MVLVLFSFLFFGRDMGTYDLLLIPGSIIAALSFIAILFKDRWKSRILWLLVVVISVPAAQASEPWLITRSYRIMIDRHESLFAEVNRLLAAKPGTIYYTKEGSQDSLLFTEDERKTIRRLLAETPVYFIARDTQRIYYGTFGRIDVHHGVTYFYSDRVADKPYEFIKPHWYR